MFHHKKNPETVVAMVGDWGTKGSPQWVWLFTGMQGLWSKVQ